MKIAFLMPCVPTFAPDWSVVTLAENRMERVLVDAEKAVRVMGGAKRGIMATRSKWAFSIKSAAETFIEDDDGTIVTGAKRSLQPGGTWRRKCDNAHHDDVI